MDIEFVKVVTRFARSDLLSDDPGTKAPTLYASALRSLSQKRFFSAQPRRTLRLGGGILRKKRTHCRAAECAEEAQSLFPDRLFRRLVQRFNGNCRLENLVRKTRS